MSQSNWKLYLMLGFATACWGTAFIAGKFATEVWHPYMVAFLRFFGASLLLYPYMKWKEPNPPSITRNDWALFAILGLSGCSLYNVFFFIATQKAPIIKSALVIAWNPILISIFAGLFLKETITRSHILGSIVATIGVVIIIAKGSINDLIALRFEPIDAILLGAVVCWATYSVVGKVVLKKFSPVVSTTYACLFGTFFLIPAAIVTFNWQEFQQATWVAWISVLDTAVLVSVVSFIMYYQGIRELGAAKASIFINFMPLSA
ncbi:DMT family transporter [Ammoniphilus oxalaticus]|uniref:DMT family transporter n=1 Tax=Ammoniphilus oxalaticus TaxID=66863 RepID=UPI001FE7FB42|nr:DMT family transporter [Ammoniphilus oxalaticus]